VLTRLLALIKKEFLSVLKSKQSRMLIIVPPLLQMLMAGYALNMEVTHIHLGVWDKAQTLESRELLAGFASSRWYDKITYYDNMPAVQQAIVDTDVNCAIIINEDFSRNLAQGKQAALQLILDGRQVNSSAIINGYVSQIVTSYGLSHGGTELPIQVAERYWFNPNLNYHWTILAAIFTMLSTLPCMLLTSMSVARERELGTFEQLLVSPLQPVEILIGKTIPPFILGLIVSLVMVFLMHLIFAMPFTGSLPLLVLSIAIALLSTAGVGLFISSLCRTQQQALLGVFTFQMPATLLSGFISPVTDMPEIFQQLDKLNMMQYYVFISKGLFLKDMSTATVLSNLWPMAVLAIVTLAAATFCFRRRLE
jgi:ABC-2 type transport system permease protein